MKRENRGPISAAAVWLLFLGIGASAIAGPLIETCFTTLTESQVSWATSPLRDVVGDPIPEGNALLRAMGADPGSEALREAINKWFEERPLYLPNDRGQVETAASRASNSLLVDVLQHHLNELPALLTPAGQAAVRDLISRRIVVPNSLGRDLPRSVVVMNFRIGKLGAAPPRGPLTAAEARSVLLALGFTESRTGDHRVGSPSIFVRPLGHGLMMGVRIGTDSGPSSRFGIHASREVFPEEDLANYVVSPTERRRRGWLPARVTCYDDRGTPVNASAEGAHIVLRQ